MEKEFKTLEEFWPFYLNEHSSRINRGFHFVGTSFAIFFLIIFFSSFDFLFLNYAFVSGYFFAWIGHFFIQKNKPATFKYPFKSFISDWKMYFYILTFQIEKELKKYSIVSK